MRARAFASRSCLRPLVSAVLAFALVDCTEQRAPQGVPLLVRVQQAQTTPSFTHAVLKVYRDEGGRPTTFLKATECLAVTAIPSGTSGRHRLELAVDAGGPYFLQFTGHNDPACSPTTAVAAALAPGLMAAAGLDAVVPISATAVDRFVTLEPPAGLTNAEVVPRAFHTATVLSDGSLILAGGAQDVSVLDSAACARGFSRCFGVNRATSGIHSFDPASGAMILVGALQQRRFLHAATAGAGATAGRLVVAGGAQSATIAGNAGGADAAFVRADASCTNPNDAADSGCILASIESHALDGSVAQVGSMATGRAALALAPLGNGKVLAAGGRSSAIQPGCTTDAQCAQGATCRVDGRCVRGGQDCSQVADATLVCAAGYTCDTAQGGRCIKRGCSRDDDCGGCLQSGGCTTGSQSTCDVASGVCTKRGCSSDSECLGSNRRCIQGNCAQVACDGLSGCKSGTTCELRTGKCRPDGVSIDCSLAGQCDCRGDGDCASGFACQTSGELAGRCRNVQTGCPATVCRRDESDPAQGPYFDPNGNLRRDVNCTGGQCVLNGCRADLDCQPGFLCVSKACQAGRRVTAPSGTAEVCDLGAATLPARPCLPVAALAAPREGLAAACLVRDPTGACTATILWGGNTGLDASAELRGGAGEAVGALNITGCAVTGGCAPAQVAVVEDATGVFFLGGVGHQTAGAAQYRFLTSVYRVTPAAAMTAQLLTTQLSSARAGAALAPLTSGVVVVGGLGDALGASTNGGLLQADGSRYEEPEALRLSARRFGHTATVLPDGRIIVVGGIDPSGPTLLSSAEIYIPRNALR